MIENSTFDKNFKMYLLWFIIGTLVVCASPWLFTRCWLLDFTSTGQIGDTIGGIMGPFIAIVAAGLTFIAFWVQYKANIQQRHDIAIERFESNLFEMIHIQQEITNGVLVEYFNETKKIREISKGREVFRRLYCDFNNKFKFPDGEKSLPLNKAMNDWPDLKMHLSEVEIMWNLDHYFRHLYRILKYIDEQEESLVNKNKKYEYAAIVRAILSPYELVLLFYNGFSHPKFKELVEKYAILNNLRCDILASAMDKTMYKKKFEKAYDYANDENRDMRQEYKKGAFVSPFSR